MKYPILYTFRRCPYAMRARMALAHADVVYEVREVVLRDKPEKMLRLSEKGTVPVLKLGDRVLDESLDVMRWALAQKDPEGWLDQPEDVQANIEALIRKCDEEFKVWLDRYKYNNQESAYSEQAARAEGEKYLAELEQHLTASGGQHLFGEISLADIAVFPFIRQFANVDRPWFDASGYSRVIVWLERLLTSARFVGIMQKYEQWQPGQPRVLSAS